MQSPARMKPPIATMHLTPVLAVWKSLGRRATRRIALSPCSAPISQRWIVSSLPAVATEPTLQPKPPKQPALETSMKAVIGPQCPGRVRTGSTRIFRYQMMIPPSEYEALTIMPDRWSAMTRRCDCANLPKTPIFSFSSDFSFCSARMYDLPRQCPFDEIIISRRAFGLWDFECPGLRRR